MSYIAGKPVSPGQALVPKQYGASIVKTAGQALQSAMTASSTHRHEIKILLIAVASQSRLWEKPVR
ncbi:hypothetical protein [Dickeya dadantii]|uniref:hypothetical protein n=1 Tax=Dickeya dadantii TaxID=204038 RepID=UPI0011D0B0D6|nr:hypothetical protein [Dickeya dadantii]NPE59135.1 hypothetical protein [Dickeya dadantii]NPE72297.1 hypothetical protein [Dickeya dadantii]